MLKQAGENVTDDGAVFKFGMTHASPAPARTGHPLPHHPLRTSSVHLQTLAHRRSPSPPRAPPPPRALAQAPSPVGRRSLSWTARKRSASRPPPASPAPRVRVGTLARREEEPLVGCEPSAQAVCLARRSRVSRPPPRKPTPPLPPSPRDLSWSSLVRTALRQQPLARTRPRVSHTPSYPHSTRHTQSATPTRHPRRRSPNTTTTVDADVLSGRAPHSNRARLCCSAPALRVPSTTATTPALSRGACPRVATGGACR